MLVIFEFTTTFSPKKYTVTYNRIYNYIFPKKCTVTYNRNYNYIFPWKAPSTHASTRICTMTKNGTGIVNFFFCVL